MKTLLIFIILANICYACDDCLFIRGDANCDGIVNITDVQVIANGVYGSEDAADVDDNGAVNITDAIYLSNYLFKGGPSVQCPFPNPGKDCTSDNLSVCCSKPANIPDQVSILISNHPLIYRKKIEDKALWDNVSLNQIDNRTVLFSTINNQGCNHIETSEKLRLIIDINDPIGFTKNRLLHNVQSAGIKFAIKFLFDAQDVCEDSCHDENFLYVDMSNLKVVINVGQKTSATPTDAVVLPYSRIVEYQYDRRILNGACKIFSLDLKNGVEEDEVNISEQLSGLLLDDCEEWKIFSIELLDLKTDFIRNGQLDVAKKESINFRFEYDLYYLWCICQ